MITISEIDKSTGLVTGVNARSTDTLGDSVEGVGVANGAVCVFVDTGNAALYDKEGQKWTQI